MKKNCYILLLFISIMGGNVFAQYISVTPYLYNVEARVNTDLMLTMQLDGKGQRQGDVFLYYDMESRAAETKTLFFKGKYVDDILRDTGFFYNYNSTLFKVFPGADAAWLYKFQNDSYYGWLGMLGKISGTLIWYNGDINAPYIEIVEKYENGVKHGITQTFHPNGKLAAQYNYNRGERDGPFTTWFEDGIVWEKGSYAKGQLSGVLLYYNWDGKLVKSHTCYGCASDTIKQYLNTGELKSIATQSFGIYQGNEYNYFKTGELSRYRHYNAYGKLDSTDVLYFLNGNVKERIHYKNGIREGLYERFYEYGEKKILANFKKDRLHGDYFSWYENGQLESKGRYIEGYSEDEEWEYYDSTGKKLPIGLLPYNDLEMLYAVELMEEKKYSLPVYTYALPQMVAFVDGQMIKAEPSLEFLKKYKEGIRIKANVDAAGGSSFEILDRLSKKNKNALDGYLRSKNMNKWRPFKINGRWGTATVYFIIALRTP